jgi:hypothetical protein
VNILTRSSLTGSQKSSALKTVNYSRSATHSSSGETASCTILQRPCGPSTREDKPLKKIRWPAGKHCWSGRSCFQTGKDGLDLESNSFYQFIKFDTRSYYDFNDGLNQLAEVVSPLFNRDIYPDFKRIFYSAKNSDTIYLDSLSWYAGLYEIRNAGYDQNIHAYRSEFRTEPDDPGLFILSSAPDLIKRYLYLLYFAREKRDHINIGHLYNEYHNFVKALNPADTLNFRDADDVIKKDTFFNRELGSAAGTAPASTFKEKLP